MADLEPKKISAEHRLAEELGVLVSFLDPHLKARTDAERVDKQSLWSWRKTVAFVLVMGLIGWSAVVGVLYLLWTFF
jgi:hypothetical protein